MALIKIKSESMDLADNYTFTGTVTGAGDVSNLVQLATVNVSGSAYGWNPIFTSSYDTYLVTFDSVGSTSSASNLRFKFYNETGATSDNVYKGRSFMQAGSGDHSQNYHNSYPYLTVGQYNGTSEGFGGVLWIYQPLNASVMTTFSYHGSYLRNDTYGTFLIGAGTTTDFGTREHTGLYIYLENGGSFGGRSKVTLYGVKRS